MKIYLSLPIAILLFIFSANFAINLLENDAQDLTQQLQQIEAAIEKGDQAKAAIIYEKIAQKWETEYKKWAVLVDHDKLDDINRLLVKIKIDIAQNQSPDQDIAEVIYLLESIPRTEKITWQNIL
ncbi:MAG: DUF4363 family protein [Peptococcaceae bacterium]|nr:DUF4363 family protein [Peptococcaceae bacterium]